MMSSGVSARSKKEQVGFGCSRNGDSGENPPRKCPRVPRDFLPAHFLPGGLTQIALMGAVALWLGSKVNDHLLLGIILQ